MGAPHVLLAHGPCMAPPCRRRSPIWRAPNQGVPTPQLPLQDPRVATGSTQGAMYLQKGYDGEKRGMTRPMDKETVANFNLQMASGAKYSTNSSGAT